MCRALQLPCCQQRRLCARLSSLAAWRVHLPTACLLTFITGLSGCCWWRCWPLLLQVRAGELLNHVLRHHRHSQHLALQLPWRPLYDMLRALYDSAAPQVKGEQAAGQCDNGLLGWAGTQQLQ